MAETGDDVYVQLRGNDTVDCQPQSTNDILVTEAESPIIRTVRPTAIEDLPNEVLDNIFYFLDSPAPSASKLHDEPIFELTSSATSPLKSSSLVSKRWRSAALHLLFKHACLTVMSGELTPRPIMNDEVEPLLNFLQERKLSIWVQSFTLCICDKKVADTTNGAYKLDDFSGFWTTIFNTIDPHTITISAPAQALGSLTNCCVYAEDAWAFAVSYHTLQLSRTTPVEPATPPLQSRQGTAERMPQASCSRISLNSASKLFDVRPWTSILLNEGSFIKIYSSYEYFLKHPPSILPDLVGTDLPSKKPLLPPTIRDFSYIALFPTSPHFQLLTRHFPRLDRLYVQLVPRATDWDDREKMGHADTRDMWMERNSCYFSLMREMFAGGAFTPGTANFRSLKVFESGDAADEDAWRHAVESVQRGNSWRVEREGVFIRTLDENAEGGNILSVA